MSQVLPPVNTVGQAGSVGASVAAAFGRRDSDDTRPNNPIRDIPERQARPTAVDEDDADWDPASVAQRSPVAARASQPVRVTLGQLREAHDANSDADAEWDPSRVRRPVREAVDDDAPPRSGASLAASALSKMFGGAR